MQVKLRPMPNTGPSVRVNVRLRPADAAKVKEVAGTMTLSDFIRLSLAEAVEKRAA